MIKQQIDYPRPIDVDSSIKTVYLKSNGKNFKEILPSSFFSLIPAKILNETRNDDFHHFGFPSGHVSIQFALWFTLFFLFRKKWIKRVGIFMILMTMISRMYLGHHFLGDILGGALLGIMVSLAILFLVQRSAYLTELAHQYYSLSILWLPIVLIPFANYLPVWILSSLIGLNLATAIIILQKNFPVFHIIAWKRVVAAFISLLFIITVFYMGKQLIYSENGFLNLLISSLLNFAIILGVIILNSRLYLIRFRF